MIDNYCTICRRSCLAILIEEVTSFLKDLRVTYTNLWRILWVIRVTRVNDVNATNLTSLNDVNINSSVLTTTCNQFISRRNQIVVTNTLLTDNNIFNTRNNLSIVSFIGIIRNNGRLNDYFVSNTKIMVLCSCNLTVYNIFLNNLTICRNSLTCNR